MMFSACRADARHMARVYKMVKMRVFIVLCVICFQLFPCAMPMGIFLVKQFVDQVPDVLIEAAQMDGAKDLTIFFKIVLPLIKPVLATIAILSFQSVWNSTEASSIFINNESLKNFAFYMSTLTSSNNAVAGQGVAAVASLIMFIPNLLIFIIMQKNVMSTMAHSGIK